MSKLAIKADKGYFCRKYLQDKSKLDDFAEEVPHRMRKRSKRRPKILLEEKVEIVHQVLVEHEMVADVAKEHRVSVQVVQVLVNKASKHKDYLSEQITARQVSQLKRQIIADLVAQMVEEDDFIDSVASVRDAVEEEVDVAVTEAEVRAVMVEDLGMSYRKVKPLSLQANCEKNIILRQRWALAFVGLLQTKRRLLNIDETWLGMSDFRRMKWRAKDTTNSVACLSLAPRISMIVALDNFGQSYVSLTQANSNSQIMGLFIQELAQKLDKERPNWRRDTLWIWDGASYHQSEETMKLLEHFKVPIMFLGPHSYNAAPCELFFALFKSVDINPRHVASGKK